MRHGAAATRAFVEWLLSTPNTSNSTSHIDSRAESFPGDAIRVILHVTSPCQRGRGSPQTITARCGFLLQLPAGGAGYFQVTEVTMGAPG